jgi:proteasome lid subunit RPN8/RPN11
VMRELRAAAREAPLGHEIGGRLHVERRSDGWADRIVAFEVAANTDNRPGVFECGKFKNDGPTGSFLAVHSHPSGPPRPSRGDVQSMLWKYGPGCRFAIYGVVDDDLAVYAMTPSARIRLRLEPNNPALETDYFQLPVSVEGRARPSRRTVSRAGRR